MYDTTASPLVMALPGLLTTGLLTLVALGLLRQHPHRLAWAIALAPTLGLLATQQNPLSWPLAPLILSALLATLITRLAHYRTSAALGIIIALAVSGFRLFWQLPIVELLPLSLLPLLAFACSSQPSHSGSRLFAQSLSGALIALAIALSASTETGLWIGLITLSAGLTWLTSRLININTQYSEAPPAPGAPTHPRLRPTLHRTATWQHHHRRPSPGLTPTGTKPLAQPPHQPHLRRPHPLATLAQPIPLLTHPQAPTLQQRSAQNTPSTTCGNLNIRSPLIPPSAGNTMPSPSSELMTSVHPRGCGEHLGRSLVFFI